MIICAAQIQSFKGNIDANIAKHISFIKLAVENHAKLVVFPELSLTGYEPSLAAKLACEINNPRFLVFENLSVKENIVICLGLPIETPERPQIGMAMFFPNGERKLYCKNYLHADELPYFSKDSKEYLINLGEYNIAPAICYESMLEEHLEKAIVKNANVYMASVAKHKNGVEKAALHFKNMSQKHALIIMMSNSIGASDDFNSAGHSAVWNEKGDTLDFLDEDREGILLYNLETNQTKKFFL